MISREIGQLFVFNNNAISPDYFPKRINENSIVLSKFTRILFTISVYKECLKKTWSNSKTFGNDLPGNRTV